MATWDPSLSIGHALIDAQHEEIFELSDRLVASLRRGEAKAGLLEHLSFLRRYCRDHLKAEERLMVEAGYPFIQLHRANHREFARRLERLEADAAQAGPSSALALKLNALIRGWFADHIATEDVKLGAFVPAPASHPAHAPGRAASQRPPGPLTGPPPRPARVGEATAALERVRREVARRGEATAAGAVPGAPRRAGSALGPRGWPDIAKLAREAGVSREDAERVLAVLRYYDEVELGAGAPE